MRGAAYMMERTASSRPGSQVEDEEEDEGRSEGEALAGGSSSWERASSSSQYSSRISCSSVVMSLRIMFSIRMRALSSLPCWGEVCVRMAA